MALLLEGEGHSVVQAATLAEAIEHLTATPFDLVITDSFGRTPEDALQSISGILEAAAPAPVVLCTGHRLLLDDLERAGVRGMIRKPFQVDAFLAQINGLCSLEGTAA
jgi:CheY-like chemotaxis protein